MFAASYYFIIQNISVLYWVWNVFSNNCKMKTIKLLLCSLL